MKPAVIFRPDRKQEVVLVHFELSRTLTPEDLAGLAPPDLVQLGCAHLGVILSGRGPIWLYGFLIHYYHPCSYVAIYDPRLQGGIVVASHKPGCEPGDLIPYQTVNSQ